MGEEARHAVDAATRRRTFTTRGGKTLSFTSLGFGSAPLGNYLRPLSEEECDRTLSLAWDSGLRYYDTAPLYGLGLSEVRIGRLLRGRNRDDYLLSTKVGRLLEPCAKEEVNGGFFVETPQVRFYYDYSYDGVMRSFEESKKRMGIDRVDILFVHDVCAMAHGSREASEARIRELMDQGGWRALAELRDAGVVAAIGAGVNEWQPCARLLELADPDIFLLAGRYTLLEQEPIDRLFPECRRRTVGIVVGGPYNSGILAGKDTYNYAKAPAEVVERVKQIAACCDRHDVPLPRAALHFVLANPVVVSVIPGGQNPEEMRNNVEMVGGTTPPALWQELKDLGLLHPDAPVPA